MMHSTQPAYIKGIAMERVAKAKQYSVPPSWLPFLLLQQQQIYHQMTLLLGFFLINFSVCVGTLFALPLLIENLESFKWDRFL